MTERERQTKELKIGGGKKGDIWRTKMVTLSTYYYRCCHPCHTEPTATHHRPLYLILIFTLHHSCHPKLSLVILNYLNRTFSPLFSTLGHSCHPKLSLITLNYLSPIFSPLFSRLVILVTLSSPLSLA